MGALQDLGEYPNWETQSPLITRFDGKQTAAGTLDEKNRWLGCHPNQSIIFRIFIMLLRVFLWKRVLQQI